MVAMGVVGIKVIVMYEKRPTSHNEPESTEISPAY